MQLNNILQQFNLENYSNRSFGNGLINKTWILENSNGESEYILQQINPHVFKTPEDIAFNIRLLASHIQQENPGYLFTTPLQTKEASLPDGQGSDLVKTVDGYFRIFSFIKNSHTIDVVQKPEQAYEAAKQFGRFTKILSVFDASKLRITLPYFHDLSFRYKQFEEAFLIGNIERIEQSKHLVDLVHRQKNIVDEYEKIKSDPAFKIRVTHHDTKISNVLFDENDKGICVIDLDTVMPGYFISDLGDMMRTYLSPVNEEEKDLDKIEIRKDFYEAILNGYLSEMSDELTETEKNYFIYAGRFMIYMQAIRFLTDHLNNDVYYGAKYEGHNYVRAENQLTLLHKLQELEN